MAAGLGAVGNSFIEGMNGARDRQYLESQRARLIEEQQRADQERKDLQGIKTTEEYQAENPDWVEPVRKDDEGNDMPGVTDAGKTITATRNRSQAAITGDIANAYKKSGNIAQYTANTEKAQKLTLDDANKQATALMAQADGMPLMDYAKAAANIFSSDALPFSIKGVKEDPAGGVVFTVQNDQNGVQRQVPFKDTASINRALQSMYQPETFQKLQADKAASANRIAEDVAKERAKTVTTKPGETVQMWDPATNSYKEVASNSAPPNGYEDVTDPNTGVTRRVKIGTSGGNKGATKTGQVPQAIELGLKGNEALIPAATSIASILQQNNPNMPPETAHALAVEAAKGQNVKTTFDPSTGLFNRHYTDIAEVDPKTGQPLRYASNKTYLVDANEYTADGAGVTKDQAAAAVKQLQAQAPAEYKQYVAATTPEGMANFKQRTDEAWGTVVSKTKEALAQADKDAATARSAGNKQGEAAAVAQKAKIEAAYNATFDQLKAQQRKLELVREFYKAEPAGAAPDNTSKPLTVTERLKTPGGLGGAVPRDAAERAAAGEAEAIKRSKEEAAAKAAKAAADKQAQDDVKGLTPEVIRQISDRKQAQEIYTKYSMQLNGFQREALQQQIYKLSKQAPVNF
jgi:hypothetical protein